MLKDRSPPMLRKLRGDGAVLGADSAYSGMIDTLRGFLDQLACAGLDEATAGALDQDLREWTQRLTPMRVAETEQMFGRVQDAPGRGQVMSPAFAVIEQDETSLRAKVIFGRYFLGGNNAAHGGAVALLFDEVLGGPANAGVGTMARTAYLHVNYRSVTPIGKELEVTARIVSIDGRKRIVRGELKDGERLCADAEGLFLELLPGQQ
jgi:acyl-coenzyme A thioesterase PaaI-like protein